MVNDSLITIGQLAKQSNLSIRTLRFYEDKGILSSIRDRNNNRLYDDNAQHWANFVKYLRDSGMGLNDIQHYHQLILQGDATVAERIAILENQKQIIHSEIKAKEEQIKQIDHKLSNYRSEKKGYL
ncbi:MerR family transcriptional regulator [Pediococcus claussenii]|uniref:Transcriptional regulator, MerR family n=1 Tax=Pediococcus claussenii (strain ATCC BAA-344 / DSM 14800 / JCM 18046 / KCTC 3811 / LMG 21948 / P06) TaxID=701521 RepID=G8PEY0_PEDCP|nr:MerR family transcriptional regulator [Pediococcus claussenii]AEV95659.1 Transcriptional regulator, MerR family [Pediococcus claussenii ATCC BAA-344]ANZ69174.1 hypothetical protein AYR57_02150 [Pediococcus claussenii]ANZ70991.1 hypothetical protein AYR58_02150 [Pediococcus claussenii]KRN20108.1 hypothetical protein IV79_GL000773 [Pediococcus claussenii]